MPIYYAGGEIGKIYQGPNELGAIYNGDNKVNPELSKYIIAKGGTVTTSGSYKFHTFTATGSSEFRVLNIGDNPNVNYLIVAGGGGSPNGESNAHYGSGGAGGTVRTGSFSLVVTSYPVSVGGGGNALFSSFGINGNPGTASAAFSVTASGGTGGFYIGNGGQNTDYLGGAAATASGFGAGGGAGAGQNGASANTTANGGDGILWSGSYYGGGGGGVLNDGTTFGTGGLGGGANGKAAPGNSGTNGLGGGGGGVEGGGSSGAGGSGTVIITYQYQD